MEHTQIFKALNGKILETRNEQEERNSLFSSCSKSSRSSHQSSLARKADMLARAARLETELKFFDVENEKASEFKKIKLMTQIATSQAQIKAVAELAEEHGSDLAVEAHLLEPAESSHERVQAYLVNQIDAVPFPVAVETQTDAVHPPVTVETQGNAAHPPVAVETQGNAAHPPIAVETQGNVVHPPVAVETPGVFPSSPEQTMLNPEITPFVPTFSPTDQQATNSTANPSPNSISINPSRNPDHDVNTVQQPNHDANVLHNLSISLLSGIITIPCLAQNPKYLTAIYCDIQPGSSPLRHS